LGEELLIEPQIVLSNGDERIDEPTVGGAMVDIQNVDIQSVGIQNAGIQSVGPGRGNPEPMMEHPLVVLVDTVVGLEV